MLAKRLYTPVVFLIVVTAIYFISGSWARTKPARPNLTPSEIIANYSVDQPIPVTKIHLASGEASDLPSLLAKPTLVEFWSSFCGECQRGLTDLQKFSDQHPELNILLVNHKNNPAEADKFLSDNNINLKTVYDLDGSAFLAWHSTMPGAFVVKDEKIVLAFPGRISEEHLKAISQYLSR